MLLQRQTLQTQRVILPRIRIQRFITKEVESPAVEFTRAAARPQVEPASGSSTVLGRKLIANKLNFLDGFQRRREPFPRGSIIVVIQAVDRDVVRIRRCAGNRKTAGFLWRCARTRAVIRQVASRKRFLADAAERENQFQRRTRIVGQRVNFTRGHGAADDRARRIDLSGVNYADYHGLSVDSSRLQHEIDLNVRGRNGRKVSPLFCCKVRE
jgi:hypothetical protein